MQKQVLLNIFVIVIPKWLQLGQSFFFIDFKLECVKATEYNSCHTTITKSQRDYSKSSIRPV